MAALSKSARTKNRLLKRAHEIEVWRKKPLGAFVNILRLALARRLRTVKVGGFPFVLYYEPTTFCNLKCPSCPTGTGLLDRPKDAVNPDTFKKTIDALADRIFVLNMYNWGEPLLHKQFSSLVRYAAERGILVASSSNLSVPLSPKQCDDIVQSGLYSLKVGIDGASAPVHAMYRRGSILEQVHDNIRAILQARESTQSSTPYLSVAYHVFAHNEGEIEEFYQQMARLGVDSYSAVAAWVPPDGSVSVARDPRYDMYATVNKTLSSLRAKANNLAPCSWLYYASIINPSGTISPCCGVVSQRSDFGKLVDGDCDGDIAKSFHKEWNGPKYVAARELFMTKRAARNWAEKNMNDLTVDGMAFSGKGASMICAQCPMPHTLEQWAGLVTRIYKRMSRASWECLKNLDLKGAVINAAKALIIRLAVLLQ